MKVTSILLLLIHISVFANRQQDSLALVALQEAKPANLRSWDYTQPMNLWYGVSLKNDRVDSLVLRNQTEIPTAIANLTELRVLLWGGSFDKAPSVPDEFYSLTKLERLNIQWIDSLSPLIKNLQNLRYLRFYTAASSLPREIGELTNLLELEIDHSPLKTVPSSIANLSNLETLLINSDSLQSITGKLGQLTKLKRLMILSGTLDEFPMFICKLANLTELRLTDNKITSLPAKIGDLSKLDRLYLGNNRLTSLPQEIQKLTSLRFLSVEGNSLQYDDYELATKIPELFFYGDLKQELIPVTLSLDSASLTVEVRGTKNIYRWYRNNKLMNDTSKSIPVPLDCNEDDEFRCVIYNDSVKKTMLYSTTLSGIKSNENKVSLLKEGGPHSTDGAFHISNKALIFEKKQMATEITIYDLKGRVLQSSVFEGAKYNLPNLSAGNYLIQLHSQNVKTATKILVTQ